MKRKAQAVWRGAGKDGKGSITTGSGALKEQPYSTLTRFEDESGRALTSVSPMSGGSSGIVRPGSACGGSGQQRPHPCGGCAGSGQAVRTDNGTVWIIDSVLLP